jgi:hypothetical protein
MTNRRKGATFMLKNKESPKKQEFSDILGGRAFSPYLVKN